MQAVPTGDMGMVGAACRRGVLFAAILGLMLAAAGRATAGDRYVLVSHAGASDPFWKVVFKGASAAARETGVDLSIRSPGKVNDYSRQIALLDNAVEEGVAAIATTITDADAFGPALRRARDAGIPVIAYNARPTDHAGRDDLPYAAYIGMNDYKAGRKLAREAWRRGDLKGRVAVLIQQAGHAGLEARHRGISEVLAEKAPDLAVDRVVVGSDARAAAGTIKAYLDDHAGVSAFLSLGPLSAHPAGRVLKRRDADIFFAAVDMTPLMIRMIRDGLLAFTLDQQPYMQGYLAVKLMRLTARYGMEPPDVNTEPSVVDSENVGRVAALARKRIR